MPLLLNWLMADS